MSENNTIEYEEMNSPNDISNNIVSRSKEKNDFLDRRKDKGFTNNGSSVSIRDNGEVSLAAGKTAQYKINKNQGSATEISMQSNTITNRKNIKTDELIINNHKFNTQLIDLADHRQLFNDPTKSIGNFTMMGTVLVKAWEPNLGRYVLIRRQVRMPMFHPVLNLADAPEELDVDTDISDELINSYKRGE